MNEYGTLRATRFVCYTVWERSRLEMCVTEVPDMRFEPKGLPVIIAVTLVIANYALQFFPALGILATSNLLLHLGIIVGLLSLLIGDTL